jgi:imidazolonepropionase-like amidohydrolase
LNAEMLLLHRAGLTRADTFRVATLGGARALALDGEVGTVAPGKRAHLVLVDQNPLARPQALLELNTVVKYGVVYENPSDAS